MLTLGKPVADLSLPSTGGSTFRLADQRGKKLVLYFYPYEQLRHAGSDVVGVSRDSLKSHEAFKAKNLYRSKVRGIERSTFVIDGEGRLAREWRGVKVPGHVEEVLNFVKAL